MEPVVVGVIVFLILLAINLGFNIPARIKGYFYSDKLIIIFSCIQNLLVGILVMCIDGVIQTAENHIEIGYVLGMVFFFPISIGSNVIIVGCCKEKNKTRKMFLSFSSRIKGRPNEAQNYIERAHANPPVISIEGKFMNCTYIDYVDYIPYQTWQSESSYNDEIDTDSSLVLVKIQTEFNFTEDLEKEIEEKDEMLLKMTKTVGKVVYHKRNYAIYNVTDDVIFTKESCVLNFIQNCFGKILFFLLHFVGLSPIFDNLVGLICKSYTIYVKKSISKNNNFSVPAYQPDPKLPNGEKVEKHLLPSIPQVPLIHVKAYNYAIKPECIEISITDKDRETEVFKYYDSLFEPMLKCDPLLGYRALRCMIGDIPTAYGISASDVHLLELAVSGQEFNIQLTYEQQLMLAEQYPGMKKRQSQIHQMEMQMQMQQMQMQMQQMQMQQAQMQQMQMQPNQMQMQMQPNQMQPMQMQQVQMQPMAPVQGMENQNMEVNQYSNPNVGFTSPPPPPT